MIIIENEKYLKYLGKKKTLVWSHRDKKEVKQNQIFSCNEDERNNMLSVYKGLFEEVEKEDKKKDKEEKAIDKAPENKSIKSPKTK